MYCITELKKEHRWMVKNGLYESARKVLILMNNKNITLGIGDSDYSASVIIEDVMRRTRDGEKRIYGFISIHGISATYYIK